MEKVHATLLDIWKSHKNYFAENPIDLGDVDAIGYLAAMFCPGPFYYYVLDAPTQSLSHVSGSVEQILGVRPEEFTLQSLVSRVHPEDVPFALRCEDIVAYFFRNCISPDKIVKYKSSYCMRQQVRDGTWRMFLMQVVPIKTREDGAVLKVFCVHTDISHLTRENNHRLSFIGLEGEPSWLEIDTRDSDLFANFTPYQIPARLLPFSKRELDVVRLMGSGCSTVDIARRLNISEQTVATHRKNMLRKSGLKNSTELVVACIRKGYI